DPPVSTAVWVVWMSRLTPRMRTLVDEPSSFCSFFCTGRGALSPMETSIALPCFILSRFAQRSLTTASMYGGVPGSRGTISEQAAGCIYRERGSLALAADRLG